CECECECERRQRRLISDASQKCPRCRGEPLATFGFRRGTAAIRGDTMSMDRDYDKPEPTRAEVDAWGGPAVLEFGAGWCPYCQGAQPAIEAALADFPQVKHVKVGDGKGKPLGR